MTYHGQKLGRFGFLTCTFWISACIPFVKTIIQSFYEDYIWGFPHIWNVVVLGSEDFPNSKTIKKHLGVLEVWRNWWSFHACKHTRSDQQPIIIRMCATTRPRPVTRVALFSRWWFQICFIFTPIWGRFPFWLICFKGVETTNQFWLNIWDVS